MTSLTIFFSSFLLIFLVPHIVSGTIPEQIHKIPLRYTNNYIYYASLDFGSKRQSMEVQVDTGSRTMAVFCDICQKGCVLQQQFKTSESTTFKTMTCGAAKAVISYLSLNSELLQECLEDCQGQTDDYQCVGDLVYGSGSLGSYLEYDVAFEILGIKDTQTRVPSTFGCIFQEKNFKEGIWGLSISPTNEFLDSIYQSDKDKGLNPKKIFTICTNGTDSVLNIGGIDPTYHIGEGITIRIDGTQHLWWKLQDQDIGKFKINGSTIREDYVPLGKGGIILDSGTDTIVLPSVVATNIQGKIDQLCDSNSVLCQKGGKFQIFDRTYTFSNAREFFSSLPPLEIELGGKILKTPISNYFWRLKEDTWALGIIKAEDYGFPISILGSTWMNNFDISFDREDNTISIFQITRCSPSGRLLQSQDDQDDPYELPEAREKTNTFQSLENIKKKHKKSFEKLQGGN